MVTTREGSHPDRDNGSKISDKELRKLRLEVEEELVEFKMTMNNLRKFDAETNRRLSQSDFNELARLNEKIYKHKRDLDRSDAISIRKLRSRVADLVKDAEASDLMVYVNVQDVINNYRALLSTKHYSSDIKKKAVRELNKVLSKSGVSGSYSIYDQDRSNQNLDAAIKKLEQQSKKISVMDLKRSSDLSLYSHRERINLDNRRVGSEKFKDAFLKNPGRFNPDDLIKDIYGVGFGSLGLHGIDDILGISDRLSGVTKVGLGKLRGRYSKKDYLNKFASVDKESSVADEKRQEDDSENLEDIKTGIQSLAKSNKTVIDQLKESEVTQTKMINNQMTQIRLEEKSISEISEAINRDNISDSLREKKASKGLLGMLAGIADGSGLNWKDALGIGGGAAGGGGLLGWLKGKGGSVGGIFKGSSSILGKVLGKAVPLIGAYTAYSLVDEIPTDPKELQKFIEKNSKSAEGLDKWILDNIGTPRSWLGLGQKSLEDSRKSESQLNREREKEREDLAKKIAKELNPRLNFNSGLPNYPGAGVSASGISYNPADGLPGLGGSSSTGSGGGGGSGRSRRSGRSAKTPQQIAAERQRANLFNSGFLGDGKGSFSNSNMPQSAGFSGSSGSNFKMLGASAQDLSKPGISGSGANDNVKSWYDFLTKPVSQGGLGRTPEQARGEIASMRGESGSGLNSAAYNANDVDGESGGTAQWHDSSRNGSTRFTDLKKFAASQGKDWTDVGVQQQYYRQEMLGSESRANAKIMSATTAAEAMSAHISGFERPQNPSGEIGKRSQYLNDTQASGKPNFNLLGASPGSGMSLMMPNFGPGQGSAGVDKIVSENQGQTAGIRKQGIEPDLKRNIARSVYKTLGPGYRVEVYSGGQNGKEEGGPRTGSTRHDHGGAADLKIIGPDGKQISQEEYARVSQGYIASGYGGVGMQMSGGGIHMDKHTDRAKFWNYNNEGGPIVSKESQRLIDQGLAGVNPEYKYTDAEADAYLNGPNFTPQGTDPRKVRTTVVPQMDMPNVNRIQPPTVAPNISQAPAAAAPASLQTAMNTSTAKDTKNSIDDLGISMFQQMFLG
ncbi:putative tail protein [Rhizobium phage RHph_TM40]|uniref:Putative tail protein n=1 Tax=Rhizobium phage RHph_Y65 TaxID=2509785 RepID=A0A7S5UX07_9CAUD|nr:putative tail protein [Rhizobium phage RHph_Y65]QIG71817.1 putative tail protein [Rhizobium phage RHph_TM40]QIG72903.1 putative tail protein [Rhizobium phage RHph_Y65]